MAITYNLDDKHYYGTDAERLAADITKFPTNSKFIVTDTANPAKYVCNGSAWVSNGDSYAIDTNSVAVVRTVDAAPFAYDENLDVLRISGMCSNADNGGTKHHLKSAATTNATSVKATAGRVNMLNVSNLTAGAKFLKLYNLAVAPTVGTSTPFMVIPIQANSTLPVVHNDIGIYFSTGIAYAITGAVADNDTTAVGANEVLVNMIYC
jgi:hypothetical protein